MVIYTEYIIHKMNTRSVCIRAEYTDTRQVPVYPEYLYISIENGHKFCKLVLKLW